MTGALALAALLLLAPAVPPRRRRPPSPDDVAELATLVALGVDAGMTPAVALAWAGPHCHPELAAAAARALRRARREGLAAGLTGDPGPAGDLFREIARAVATGAAAGPVLAGYRERVETAARAEAAAQLQRLPIKLLFPLTLLMLPGLVLMLAGPALIEVLGRFT